jgi:hypothetical protein
VNKLVVVDYRPWKKVIVHEIIQHSIDELVKFQTLGIEPGGVTEPLYWCDGILFSRTELPETAEVIKEKLGNVVHWSSVVWAPMPKFQEVIIEKETNIRIPIFNVTTHPIYKAVAEWIKEHSKEN